VAQEVELCDELARLGYIGVAVDMFAGKATDLVPRAIWSLLPYFVPSLLLS
jgi:hypothetical protein